MPRRSIDCIIDQAIAGKDVRKYAAPKFLRNRKADQPRSGIISLYYKGELNETHQVEDSNHRRKAQARMIKKCSKLQGEKVILWQPQIL